MKTLGNLVLLLAVVPFLASCSSFGGGSGPSTSVSVRCNGPDFNARRADGSPQLSEAQVTADYEMQLRAAGIKGHNTRFWNGCIQTFVKVDGKDVMKFYDPETLREVR